MFNTINKHSLSADTKGFENKYTQNSFPFVISNTKLEEDIWGIERRVNEQTVEK